MAHIPVPEGLPGIVGPMMAYPETAKPLNMLANALLVKDSDMFSKADREMVAGYVSYLNRCVFCSESHGAVADFHSDQKDLSRRVWEHPESAPITQLMKAFLNIAAKVQEDARTVSAEDMDCARKLGASDADLHDVVLIAAAFCMYNRYVDGLGTMQPPRRHESYAATGQRLGTQGYQL